MRHSKWICLLLAAMGLSAAGNGVWAQEAAPAAAAVTYKPAQAAGSAAQPCASRFEFHPELDGVYRIGGDIKAPKVKHIVAAKLSDEARTRGAFNPFKAEPSTVSYVVDAQGLPQDVCIMKPAGYGLDAEAAKAVWQYRFQPATKGDGTPVAVRVSMQVTFSTQPQ